MSLHRFLACALVVTVAGCQCGSSGIEDPTPQPGDDVTLGDPTCGGLCGGATGLCVPGAQQCVQCLSDADCEAPTPRCNASNVCEWVPPERVGLIGSATGGSGENCSDPLVLSFVNNRVVVDGTNVGAVNDNFVNGKEPEFPKCGTFSPKRYGPDVVYKYTLTQAQDVNIVVTPTDGRLNPVVYVKKGHSCAGGAEEDFVWDVNTNKPACHEPLRVAPAELRLYDQQPGDYYIWVDSTRDNGELSVGPFRLDVSLFPATKPSKNDKCESATPIPQLPAKFSGNQLTATDNYVGTCGATALSDGAEVVYSFELKETRKVSIEVTPSPGTPGFIPYLYLRNSLEACNVTTNVRDTACSQAQQMGAVGRLIASSLPAGKYFLIVDGASGAEFVNAPRGIFTVSIDATAPDAPPSNQSCGTAQSLTFDANGIAKVIGSTYGAANNTDVAPGERYCPPSNGADVVYKFNTSAVPGGSTNKVNARIFLATLNREEYLPRMFVRTNCESTAINDQFLCFGWNNDTPHEARAMEIDLEPNTDYYLWVDAASATRLAGPFQLEVQLATFPAPNDRCESAQTVAPNSSLVGTTLGALNDYEGNPNTPANPGVYTGANCTTFLRGSDVAYKFTAEQSGLAAVRAMPDQAYNLGLAVFSETCGAGACIGVSDQSVLDIGEPESVIFPIVAGRTYFIVVDSPNIYNPAAPPHGNGKFLLELEVTTGGPNR